MPLITPPSSFSIYSSNPCNDVSLLSSMLASHHTPSFLDTYNLSTSSPGCSALDMVISFLVLWSICLSSSLLYFKEGLEYLTWKTTQVCIPLISFLLDNFVSNSFLVLQYSLLIFKNFISSCLMVSASQMPKYVSVPFSPSILILSWFGCSMPSVRCNLPPFMTSMTHFSPPNAVPMSWLYILAACIRVSRYLLLASKPRIVPRGNEKLPQWSRGTAELFTWISTS